jgi:hypothetical protein
MVQIVEQLTESSPQVGGVGRMGGTIWPRPAQNRGLVPKWNECVTGVQPD